MASERIQRHIDSSLDEADQAVANEDWPTVASRARAVLRMDHENSDGLSYAERKVDSNFDSNRGGQLRTLGNSRGQYIGIIDMTRTPRNIYGQVAPNS